MYAEFLETVEVVSDRRMALTLAIECDLPVMEIKSRVVKNIFRSTFVSLSPIKF